MKAIPRSPLLIHGWSIFAHPLFSSQLDSLTKKVEEIKKKNPEGYLHKNATKRLSAITTLAFDVIPQDPTRKEYRLGGALGETHRHWMRAKFYQQYRLFFRYHERSRIIIYAWVNDEETKRAYESDQDAYLVFKKMLNKGHPPDDWNHLLAQAEKPPSR